MKRVCMQTNLDRFGDSFGVSPVVCADIWVDLQTTTVPAACIDTKRKSCTLHTMLLSIRFLKKHDTETDRSGSSKKCDRFCRDWGWCFLEKIAALRAQKIVWPDTWTTVFTVSADGVQCRFHEVKHTTLSKDPRMCAHKFNGPGLACTLALSICTSNLVFLHGPDTPGNNPDLEVCRRELKPRIPAGKKVVADSGHRDKTDPTIGCSNAHDPRELRKLKGRAKARQESFHSRLKRFEAIAVPFRHGMDRHKTCFEAICVICQCEMELVSPLFDV